MSKMEEFILFLDLFGEPITLHLSGSKRFRTKLGALLTFAMFSLVITFSYRKFTSVIFRNDVTVELREEIQASPMKLDFTHRFGFSITNSLNKNLNSLNGKRYFDIYALLGSYVTLSNGTQIRNKKYFNLRTCGNDSFPMFSPKQLEREKAYSWLCFDTKDDDFLETIGKFGDTDYKYLQISLSKCSNATKTGGDYCAGEEEMRSIFKSKIYMNINFVNNLLDMTNYDSPLTPYFDLIAYLISDQSYFVQKEACFTPINVQTDQNRIFNLHLWDSYEGEDIHSNDDFIYERQIDDYSIASTEYFNGSVLYTSFYLKSGVMNKIYKRKYVLLQDFIESFGSFLSFFFGLFKIFNSLMNSHRLNLTIAKSLYRIQNPKLAPFWKIENFKAFIWGKFISKCLPRKNMTNFQDPISSTSFRARLTKITTKRNALVKSELKSPNLSVGLVEKTIRKDTDLIEILRNIQQIESLKQVLLTPEQRLLLNFAKKPKIIKREDFKSYNAERAFKTISERNEQESDMNKKILSILDKEFLEKVKQAQGNSILAN